MIAEPVQDNAASHLEVRADAIFAYALGLDGDERAAYVERACGDEEPLRRLVDQLLEGALGEDSLLCSGGAWGGTVAGEAETVEVGAVLEGRFRLLRELGQGGMGTVFLAERADGQFEQKVALKVIHGGAGRRSAERFVRERQILARLSHPRIARLIDGGICPSGQPYLVMEHIEGRTIDRFCSEEGLGIARRTALLAEVCDAVQAAHRQLVVHRDLKPSNILVTDSGEVKLLDFGIAKLLDEDTAGGSGITRTGGPVMTPQYASPEQYRGDAVTVATDVYQLGLVAYELLSGHRPFELAEASPMEAVRRVCYESPTRPSTVASPSTARHQLEGDLDAIVLAALHKEPERRYGSAEQLANDLRCYLAGRPVSARADHLGYRLGKFLGRHRWSVTAVLATFALLLVAGLGFTWRLAQERDRTRAQALAAEEQRRHAEEVSTFLVSLFDASDPLRNPDEPPSVRQILDRGAERIGSELADQPATQARLMRTIGRIYHVLGQYHEARELLTASLELGEEAADYRPLELAEGLDLLARVEMVLGDPERSFGYLEKALELRRAAGEEGAIPAILHRLASCRQYQSRWAEAEALGRRAVSLARRLDQPAFEVARYLDGWASSLDELGRVEEARALYRQILALRPDELGAWHPSRAITSSNFAATYAREKDFENALPLFEQALEILRRALGEDHPHGVIIASNLATCYRELGCLDEAETIYRWALDLRRRIYGEEHLEVARSLVDLANLAMARGASASAEELLRRSLAIQEADPVGDHPFRGLTLGALGQALRQLGRGDEAVAVLERARDVLTEAFGPDHAVVAEPLLELALAHRDQGEVGEAERLLRRVVEIRRGAEGMGSASVRRAEELLLQVAEVGG